MEVINHGGTQLSLDMSEKPRFCSLVFSGEVSCARARAAVTS